MLQGEFRQAYLSTLCLCAKVRRRKITSCPLDRSVTQYDSVECRDGGRVHGADDHLLLLLRPTPGTQLPPPGKPLLNINFKLFSLKSICVRSCFIQITFLFISIYKRSWRILVDTWCTLGAAILEYNERNV